MTISPLSGSAITHIFAEFDPDSPKRCEKKIQEWKQSSGQENNVPSDDEYRWRWVATELLNNPNPPHIPNYGAEKRATHIQRFSANIAIISLGGIALLAVLWSVAHALRVAYADHKLWDRIPKRLPNGEIETRLAAIRHGNSISFYQQIVYIKVPRDLSDALWSHYTNMYNNSFAQALKSIGIFLGAFFTTLPFLVTLNRSAYNKRYLASQYKYRFRLFCDRDYSPDLRRLGSDECRKENTQLLRLETIYHLLRKRNALCMTNCQILEDLGKQVQTFFPFGPNTTNITTQDLQSELFCHLRDLSF